VAFRFLFITFLDNGARLLQVKLFITPVMVELGKLFIINDDNNILIAEF